MLFDKSWPTPVNVYEDTIKGETVQAKILISTIDRLETEKESLMNTVSDLRQLLQRVAKQQEREAQRRRNHTIELETEVKRLKTALEVTEKHSGHLQDISMFWQEFLE
ncbi:hypothetical protein SteCoe_21337 [Stentor coeruleus]|uniref:Uncharacterized protein n=1 Tax=Stentor coeruleus TaxID=5963 RepID=A0A1R2BPV1_9CILI|nr:hypothetical protein SteCoe_21337 [Stentor coeruleus]